MCSICSSVPLDDQNSGQIGALDGVDSGSCIILYRRTDDERRIELEKSTSRIENYMETLSDDEQKRLRSEAGRASVAARAEKKKRDHTISAALRVLMEGNYLTAEHRDALAQRGLDADEIDGAMAVAAAMYDRAAISADTAAARFVAEYTEGKPTDKVEIGGIDGKPIEAIDLTKLSDDELQKLIAKRRNTD